MALIVALAEKNVAKSFDDKYSLHSSLAREYHRRKREHVINVARQFAENSAQISHGKSMVIIGAAMNHWYHMDMNYRSIITMLVMWLY